MSCVKLRSIILALVTWTIRRQGYSNRT